MVRQEILWLCIDGAINMTNDKKLTLSVYENSPHIWRGGLSDVELAEWLMHKANALLWRLSVREQRKETRKKLADAEACARLIEDYTNLGISSAENDPIQPLSRESIQHACCLVQLVAVGSRGADTGTPPMGYSLIPELAEARKSVQQKKADALQLLRERYGEIPEREQRRHPEGFEWMEPLFEDR
ncbi:hypothetical protein ECLT68_2712 [Escherichia coli LT-68]|nr:hypothetical protein ECLT68_2712 [Escherichia coli LT-68]